jgi:hypothetical protein
MERAVLHRTNDSYRATNPADEFLGPEPEDEDEDEMPEPTVEEVWDPMAAEYVTTVTFASGSKFTIVQERDGAYAGDYSIHGKGFYADGYSSPEKAIDYLIDMVMS